MGHTSNTTRWVPGVRFYPAANDMLYCDRHGKYTMEGRKALIVRWCVEAEQQAINAIITMMTGGLQ